MLIASGGLGIEQMASLINQVRYTSKTWTHLIKEDLRKLRLQPGFTKDWEAWKRAIEKSPLNPC